MAYCGIIVKLEIVFSFLLRIIYVLYAKTNVSAVGICWQWVLFSVNFTYWQIFFVLQLCRRAFVLKNPNRLWSKLMKIARGKFGTYLTVFFSFFSFQITMLEKHKSDLGSDLWSHWIDCHSACQTRSLYISQYSY